MKLQWILLTALVAASAIDSAQSCSVWRWAKCAAAVAGCAAACIDPLDPVCVACLGPSYQECRPCIGLAGTINGLVTLQGAQGQTCSAWDWVECGSRFFDCEAPCDSDRTAPLCSSCVGGTYSKCTYCLPAIAAPNATVTELAQLLGCSFFNKIKCAAKVAECAATCASEGITSSQCISCFGSSYQQCKGCLPFDTAVQSVNSLQGCSTIGWLRCAGAVARCSAECIEHGVRSPQCFQCLGSHYQACISCISSEDIEDMRQFAIAQRAATTLASGAPKHASVGVWATLIISVGVVMKMML